VDISHNRLRCSADACMLQQLCCGRPPVVDVHHAPPHDVFGVNIQPHKARHLAECEHTRRDTHARTQEHSGMSTSE
jgi:hypothetical protein